MLDFLRTLPPILVPLFVVVTMLNVGLTQKPADIIRHLDDRGFVLRMLLANFVLVPLLMVLALRFTQFDPGIEAALLIFAFCAGAPFLIKLTQTSGHDVALGAATMLLLIFGSVAFVPLALPLALEGATVDAWAIASSLLVQMVVPIAVGMLLAAFLPSVAGPSRPLVGLLSNLLLYAVLGSTLLGYLPDMREIAGTGAILFAGAFVVASFAIGYLMGRGQDHLEDVGGLGTAQRNTAAGLLIAAQNFNDPDVLVMMTVANTVGLVILLLAASYLSRDNRVRTEPV